MAASTDQIRICIVGAGIASLCLAHTVSKQLKISKIHVLEAGADWRDAGASFALGTKSQEALDLMSSDLRQALNDAGGTPLPEGKILMGTGPRAGEMIKDLSGPIPPIHVLRGPFWRYLKRTLPDTVTILAGKRVSTVVHGDNASAPISVTCEDGSSYEFDAVVGCDGVNSVVRTAVLQPGDPALDLEYTFGYYFHQTVIPFDEAVEIFGSDYCKKKEHKSWAGADGGFLLTDYCHDENSENQLLGNSMQVVCSWADKTLDPWPYESAVVKFSHETLKQKLAPWGQLGESMLKVFSKEPELIAIATRVHKETPTFYKDSVCIAGDAAQTFLPFQGAGAGQALEDALILSTVLAQCKSKQDIPKAFRAYDKVRRPRRVDVARTSDYWAHLLTGNVPEVGLDIDLMREKLQSFDSNVENYDLVAAQAEARGLMVR